MNIVDRIGNKIVVICAIGQLDLVVTHTANILVGRTRSACYSITVREFCFSQPVRTCGQKTGFVVTRSCFRHFAKLSSCRRTVIIRVNCKFCTTQSFRRAIGEPKLLLQNDLMKLLIGDRNRRSGTCTNGELMCCVIQLILIRRNQLNNIVSRTGSQIFKLELAFTIRSNNLINVPCSHIAFENSHSQRTIGYTVIAGTEGADHVVRIVLIIEEREYCAAQHTILSVLDAFNIIRIVHILYDVLIVLGYDYTSPNFVRIIGVSIRRADFLEVICTACNCSGNLKQTGCIGCVGSTELSQLNGLVTNLNVSTIRCVDNINFKCSTCQTSASICILLCQLELGIRLVVDDNSACNIIPVGLSVINHLDFNSAVRHNMDMLSRTCNITSGSSGFYQEIITGFQISKGIRCVVLSDGNSLNFLTLCAIHVALVKREDSTLQRTVYSTCSNIAILANRCDRVQFLLLNCEITGLLIDDAFQRNRFVTNRCRSSNLTSLYNYSIYCIGKDVITIRRHLGLLNIVCTGSEITGSSNATVFRFNGSNFILTSRITIDGECYTIQRTACAAVCICSILFDTELALGRCVVDFFSIISIISTDVFTDLDIYLLIEVLRTTNCGSTIPVTGRCTAYVVFLNSFYEPVIARFQTSKGNFTVRICILRVAYTIPSQIRGIRHNIRARCLKQLECNTTKVCCCLTRNTGRLVQLQCTLPVVLNRDCSIGTGCKLDESVSIHLIAFRSGRYLDIIIRNCGFLNIVCRARHQTGKRYHAVYSCSGLLCCTIYCLIKFENSTIKKSTRYAVLLCDRDVGQRSIGDINSYRCTVCTSNNSNEITIRNVITCRRRLLLNVICLSRYQIRKCQNTVRSCTGLDRSTSGRLIKFKHSAGQIGACHAILLCDLDVNKRIVIDRDFHQSRVLTNFDRLYGIIQQVTCGCFDFLIVVSLTRGQAFKHSNTVNRRYRICIDFLCSACILIKVKLCAIQLFIGIRAVLLGNLKSYQRSIGDLFFNLCAVYAGPNLMKAFNLNIAVRSRYFFIIIDGVRIQIAENNNTVTICTYRGCIDILCSVCILIKVERCTFKRFARIEAINLNDLNGNSRIIRAIYSNLRCLYTRGNCSDRIIYRITCRSRDFLDIVSLADRQSVGRITDAVYKHPIFHIGASGNFLKEIRSVLRIGIASINTKLSAVYIIGLGCGFIGNLLHYTDLTVFQIVVNGFQLVIDPAAVLLVYLINCKCFEAAVRCKRSGYCNLFVLIPARRQLHITGNCLHRTIADSCKDDHFLACALCGTYICIIETSCRITTLCTVQHVAGVIVQLKLSSVEFLLGAAVCLISTLLMEEHLDLRNVINRNGNSRLSGNCYLSGRFIDNIVCRCLYFLQNIDALSKRAGSNAAICTDSRQGSLRLHCAKICAIGCCLIRKRSVNLKCRAGKLIVVRLIFLNDRQIALGRNVLKGIIAV